MGYVNLALSGVKQQEPTDLGTIRQYHPEVMASFVILCIKLGLPIDWNSLQKIPEELNFSGSGYRDHVFDPAVKNSPHNFAMALDVCVSPLDAKIASNRPSVLEAQIKWARAAQGIFTGFGFYPYQNTVHVDLRTPEWMAKYKGTPYWVKDPNAANTYKGFYILDEAIVYAHTVASHG
jgi:hypothetical protein